MKLKKRGSIKKREMVVSITRKAIVKGDIEVNLV
jgi:hypothetical protein